MYTLSLSKVHKATLTLSEFFCVVLCSRWAFQRCSCCCSLLVFLFSFYVLLKVFITFETPSILLINCVTKAINPGWGKEPVAEPWGRSTGVLPRGWSCTQPIPAYKKPSGCYNLLFGGLCSVNTCFHLQILVILVRTCIERCLDLTQISPFALDLMHWEGISLWGDRRKISSK